MRYQIKRYHKTNFIEGRKWPVSFDYWEEDEWGRPLRSWKVLLPDLSCYEDNPTRLKIEQKEVSKLVGYFVSFIHEDMHMIRQTWAKKKEWTLKDIKRFEESLEYDRWAYR